MLLLQVLDAIRGLRTMFISKGAKLVPLNEMVDAITVNKKAKADIQRDAWVRVKTGLYKDDLAKVSYNSNLSYQQHRAACAGAASIVCVEVHLHNRNSGVQIVRLLAANRSVHH